MSPMGVAWFGHLIIHNLEKYLIIQITYGVSNMLPKEKSKLV